MSNIVVSVAMLTYNHEAYVARAIQSVLDQETRFRIDLVIGEDFSTDGTRAIVETFVQRHPESVRLITSESNVGVAANSKRVVKACRGQYVAFCEGDDYWHHPKKLQMQVDFLERNQNCGLVYSDYDELIDSTGERRRCILQHRTEGFVVNPSISDIVAGRGAILTCTIMARLALLRDIRNSDSFLHENERLLMGDTQVWAEIAARSDIGFIDQSLATRGVLEESATRSGDPAKRLRFWISNSEMCIYLCRKYSLAASLRKTHEASWTRRRLKLAYLTRQPRLAVETRTSARGFSLVDYVWYIAARFMWLRPIFSLLLRVSGRRVFG